jgi:hypothetical protein
MHVTQTIEHYFSDCNDCPFKEHITGDDGFGIGEITIGYKCQKTGERLSLCGGKITKLPLSCPYRDSLSGEETLDEVFEYFGGQALEKIAEYYKGKKNV